MDKKCVLSLHREKEAVWWPVKDFRRRIKGSVGKSPDWDA